MNLSKSMLPKEIPYRKTQHLNLVVNGADHQVLSELRTLWEKGKLKTLLKRLDELNANNPGNLLLEMSIEYLQTLFMLPNQGMAEVTDLRVLADQAVLGYLTLSIFETRIIDRVDGSQTIRELADSFGDLREQALRSILRLVELRGLVVKTGRSFSALAAVKRERDMDDPELNQQAFEDAFKSALDACNAKNYGLAERLLLRCMVVQPDNKRVAFNLEAVREKLAP